MTDIELTKVEDGVFLFDKTGKLEFCSEYSDKVLPGLRSSLNDNSYLEDVYTAITTRGYKLLT